MVGLSGMVCVGAGNSPKVVIHGRGHAYCGASIAAACKTSGAKLAALSINIAI